MKKLLIITLCLLSTLAFSQTATQVKQKIDDSVTNRTVTRSITASNVGNRMKEIVDFAETSINNKILSVNSKVQLGVRFYDRFNYGALPANYTKTGSAATITFPDSTYMTVSKTADTTFSDYITRDVYAASMQETQVVKFIPQSKTTNSYGIAIGFNSGSSRDIIVNFNTSTQTTLLAGKISLYYSIASGVGSGIAGSSSALSFSTGDTLMGIIVKDDTLTTIYYINITTNDTVSMTYSHSLTANTNIPLLNNTSQVKMYFLGGTQKVLSWQLSSEQNMFNDLYVGNSILTGYSTTKLADRFTNKIYESRSGYTIIGGPGDATTDMLNNLPEIVSYQPKNVFLCIGVNDRLSSVAASTYASRMDSAVRFLKYRNINVYLVSLVPQSVSVSTYNDSLNAIATRNGITYIDITTKLINGSGSMRTAYDCGDHIHPNSLGHSIIADIIASYTQKPAANNQHVTTVDGNSGPITLSAYYFKNTGNSLGSSASIGTNDAYDMNVKTNNTTRINIKSTGEIGIGSNASTGTPFTVSTSSSTNGMSIAEFTNTSLGSGSYATVAVNMTNGGNGYFVMKNSSILKGMIGYSLSTNGLWFINANYSTNSYGLGLLSDGSMRFNNAASGNAAFTCDISGNGVFTGTVKTANPGNGAGLWKLGKKVTATVSLVTTDYIEVEIDGVVYKLALVN